MTGVKASQVVESSPPRRPSPAFGLKAEEVGGSRTRPAIAGCRRKLLVGRFSGCALVHERANSKAGPTVPASAKHQLAQVELP